MPITEVIEKDCVEYKIKLDRVEETFTAKKILSLDPIQIELYRTFGKWTRPLNVKSEEFLKKIKLMVIDYFEVQHVDVGMQIIINEIAAGRQPPLFLLSDIVYFILKDPRTKNKEGIRKHWLTCKIGYDILVDVLRFFGPYVYLHFWEDLYSGRSHKLTMHQRLERVGGDVYNEEEKGKMEEIIKIFEKYTDFWHFMEAVLGSGNSLENRCELLIADFLIKFLQADLMERKDETESIRKSLFVKTLQQNVTYTYRKFDQYINIITKFLPFEDSQRLQIAENLLNMLITASCYDGVINQEELINQMAPIYKELNNDQCRQLLEMIKYPTFTIHMLDIILLTADLSNVKPEHIFYADMRHVPLQLEKLFEFVLKIIPPTKQSIDDIYRHVMEVSCYCINVLSTLSVHEYRRTGETLFGLTDEQMEYWRTEGPVAIEKWEKMIGNLIKRYTTPTTKNTKQKIKWAIKVTKLAVLNL